MSTFLDLNDLHTQSGCLHHLLSVLYEASTEIQYVLPNGESDRSAERLSALSIIARDECERLDQAIGAAISRRTTETAAISEIMTLFRQWDKLRDRSNEPGLDDDDINRRCGEANEVMRQILALPAKSATDLAAKLMCFTHYGDYALDQFAGGERLMWEMAALVGHSEKLADKFLPPSAQGGRSTADLHEVIEAFAAAKAAYDKAVLTNLEAMAEEFPEWEAYEAAEHAVIVQPCQSLAEVQNKARFFLDNDGPYDTIRNCFSQEEETLRTFLRSLTEGGGGQDETRLHELIAAHQAAWEALEVACKATDDAFQNDAEAAAQAVQDKAGDATADAMDAIIAHPYSSIEELKIGMAYIVRHHRSTGDGNLEAWLSDLTCRVAGIEDETGGAA